MAESLVDTIYDMIEQHGADALRIAFVRAALGLADEAETTFDTQRYRKIALTLLNLADFDTLE